MNAASPLAVRARQAFFPRAPLSADRLAGLIIDYATFCGMQDDFQGGSYELWNLRKAIPGHPKHSTVSRATLVAALRQLHG